MRGNVIAQRGYLFEQYVTYNLNFYSNGFKNRVETDLLPYEEQKKVWEDSITITSELFKFADRYGDIKQATHVGFNINKGVVDITGKQSPADVLIQFEDDSWFGVSLKYGQSRNRRLKVYAPPPNTFAERIETGYQTVYESKSGLTDKVDILTDEKMDSADALISRNQQLMISVFGEPLTNLNKDQLSRLRKIIRGDIEHHCRDAVEDFYLALRHASSNNNRRMADEFHDTIGKITELANKEIQDDLFRSMANIPRPNDSNYLPTVMINATRTPDEPKVEIYDYVTDIDNYLKSLGEAIPLNKRQGTCCFRYGPLNIEVNTRAGSRSAGAVNVTIDKKIFTDVRFQKLSNGKED